MYKTIELELTANAPLLLHNANILVNPLHPVTKEIKKISGKRNKTEDDLLALSKLEWFASLYLSNKKSTITVEGSDVNIIASEDTKVCVSGDVLEAMLINGAKKNKLGTQFKAGIVVTDNPLLNFNGAHLTIKDLWDDGNYTDMRAVRIQKNAIMRCRPIFSEWSLNFKVNYMPDTVEESQIRHAAEIGGLVVGICDYRPRYGRFSVA